jgi:hypothetical protein
MLSQIDLSTNVATSLIDVTANGGWKRTQLITLQHAGGLSKAGQTIPSAANARAATLSRQFRARVPTPFLQRRDALTLKEHGNQTSSANNFRASPKTCNGTRSSTYRLSAFNCCQFSEIRLIIHSAPADGRGWPPLEGFASPYRRVGVWRLLGVYEAIAFFAA